MCTSLFFLFWLVMKNNGPPQVINKSILDLEHAGNGKLTTWWFRCTGRRNAASIGFQKFLKILESHLKNTQEKEGSFQIENMVISIVDFIHFFVGVVCVLQYQSLLKHRLIYIKLSRKGWNMLLSMHKAHRNW